MHIDDSPPGQRRPLIDLTEHRAPRTQVLDEHMFQVPAGFGGSVTFRLQLFTAPGQRPVAIATQAEGDVGSIVNSAERAATFVWREHLPDEPQPPLWVERMLPFFDGDEPHMMLVSFEETADGDLPLCSPSWSGISAAELELLVGEPVDLDRGDRYVPQPEEPPVQIRYGILPLDQIPPAHPFRAPDRMGADRRGAERIRPTLRRSGLWRRISGQSCCWYHAGDWHKVNELAQQHLAAATASGTDDVQQLVLASIRETEEDEWTTEALWSLFAVPIDLNQDFVPATFVNGQHRVQATRDAAVRRTIVAYFD